MSERNLRISAFHAKKVFIVSVEGPDFFPAVKVRQSIFELSVVIMPRLDHPDLVEAH